MKGSAPAQPPRAVPVGGHAPQPVRVPLFVPCARRLIAPGSPLTSIGLRTKIPEAATPEGTRHRQRSDVLGQ